MVKNTKSNGVRQVEMLLYKRIVLIYDTKRERCNKKKNQRERRVVKKHSNDEINICLTSEFVYFIAMCNRKGIK